MTGEKKPWGRPQLIILARGTTDETLQPTSCKIDIQFKRDSGRANSQDCVNSEAQGCDPCFNINPT